MAGPPKPRDRSGYSREETQLVVTTCLTVAVTLGAYLDHLCVVGGLVPTLLIDNEHGADPDTGEEHPGTNDLDIGLELALLEERQYEEISARLRQEGFGPDVNSAGNSTPQRWRLGDLNVTVDFLLPAIPGAEEGGRVHALEGDFGALIAPGLEIAADERVTVELSGRTLGDELTTRTIPVAGPGAFIVLKALALNDRGEPKDAFDLVYVLRRWPGGVSDIVDRLAAHCEKHRGLVEDALAKLTSDFSTVGSIGSVRAGKFDGAVGDELDAAAADALGYVDDLLRECRKRGLIS